MSSKPLGRPRGQRDTGALLTQAALSEFSELGFAGTDSNKIARRAGFSPQTFYRWFGSKTEIFIAAYRLWEDTEMSALDNLQLRGSDARALAKTIAKHHQEHLIFRRSLRLLAIEDPDVRAARTDSRLRQIERIQKWLQLTAESKANIAVCLLQIERMADAIAEGEAGDLGLNQDIFINELATLIDKLGMTA